MHPAIAQAKTVEAQQEQARAMAEIAQRLTTLEATINEIHAILSSVVATTTTEPKRK